jgi:hypothetical protein
VNWPLVGYYNQHTDKLNSFQLLLMDRSAQTGTAGDFDIEFNYNRIQWESGDASGGGGTGGLGGTSARVGFSNGNTNSLEVFGSGVNSALIDGGVDALIAGSANSATNGRYVFPVRNGATPPGGSIFGTASDSAGAPVSGARLDVCQAAARGLQCHGTSTNAAGNYSVVALPGGQYTIFVSPPTGSSLFAANSAASLAEGQSLRVDLTLRGPQPLASGTTIGSIFVNPDGTPVLYWQTETPLSTTGCPGGTASFSVGSINSQTGTATSVGGTLSETPSGSGKYAGKIPALFPMSGAAQVGISITCPDPAQNSGVSFSIYIDPSGQVVDPSGAPVAGASVTLLRADSPDGPFIPVPSGSALMSPANRDNPATTDANGRFGWDVLSGYYEVLAMRVCPEDRHSHEASAQTPAFQVPPPNSNLIITLGCSVAAGPLGQSTPSSTGPRMPPAVPQTSATPRPG